MRRVVRALAGLAVLATPAAAGATPGAAAAEPLQMHRAVYDLTLARAGASASMVSAKGRLVYEISGSACAGYKVGSRLVTRVVDRSGTTRTTDSRSTTTETVSPPSYSFVNEELIDAAQTAVVRGAAQARSDGIAVTLETPKATQMTLPRAVFPTAHTRLVIEAAQNGDSVIEAPIYDGGEMADTVYQTTTVIGPPESGLPGASPAELATLSALPAADTATSRHYVVSYFAPGAEGEPTPRYVLTFEMLDDGVSYAATFDYGNFVMAGTLAELTLAAPEACPGEQ